MSESLDEPARALVVWNRLLTCLHSCNFFFQKSETDAPIVDKIQRSVEKLVQKQQDAPVKSSVGESETKGSIAGQEVRATAHKLPEFHEDYYGASVHEPRHH